jgi:regulator of RNase E activity RraA/CMP-N-acetylneuraminic acid synthetase
MYKKATIAAFVPAKGTSERLQNKNLSIVGGEYLVRRKLKQLLASKYIDEVWLDTESDHIINLVKDLPVRFHKRDPKLATNDTDGHQLFQNQAKQTKADIVIQALATAPFVCSETIDRAIETLTETDCSSLVAVRKEKTYEWKDRAPNYGWQKIANSFDLPDRIFETMSLYIVKRHEDGTPIKKRFTQNPYLFELNCREAMDINTPEDLQVCNALALSERAHASLEIRTLPLWTCTANACDIMVEMGIGGYLGHKIKPLKEGKSFAGRAKTLGIRPAKAYDKDDWKQVYEALKSYDFVTPGDIIVVDNPIEERAYFGDLNAALAFRRGCNGVVVNGFTRDSADHIQEHLPVFAKGCTSLDVKYHGAVESIGMPIEINGVKISEGDIIFADADGVCCIPAEHFSEVKIKLKELATNEAAIKMAAFEGNSGEVILDEMGQF